MKNEMQRSYITDKYGFVYFVQSNPAEMIKIGFTQSSPFTRMKTINSPYPYELKLLGFIYALPSKEIEIHKKFDDCKAGGEWFYPVKSLLNFIKEGTETDIDQSLNKYLRNDLLLAVKKCRLVDIRVNKGSLFTKCIREHFSCDFYAWRERLSIPSQRLIKEAETFPSYFYSKLDFYEAKDRKVAVTSPQP